MKITSKGQVTIPRQLREGLGFLPETEVEFLPDGDSLRIIRKKANNRRGALLIAHMRKNKGTAGLATKEILAFTRG